MRARARCSVLKSLSMLDSWWFTMRARARCLLGWRLSYSAGRGFTMRARARCLQGNYPNILRWEKITVTPRVCGGM